jgi:hypothetical protein
MTILDITFARAFRVWWSYAWRAILLSLIVVIPLQLAVFTWIVPHAHAVAAAHGRGRPELRQVLELLGLIWPIAIIAIIALQTAAMRWMLRRARWADFKLVVLAPESSTDP